MLDLMASNSKMRFVEAMARWYWSKVSPSLVRGQSRRCVIKISTLYAPISSLPVQRQLPAGNRDCDEGRTQSPYESAA